MDSLTYRLSIYSRLLLLTAVFFCSGIVNGLWAQSPEEKCREIQEVLERYEKERVVIENNHIAKSNESIFRTRLQNLRNFIANNFLEAPNDMQALADKIQLKPLKDIAKMSTEERTVFQKQLKSSLEQYIEKLAVFKIEDIEEQLSRVDDQIRARQNKLKEMNCPEKWTLSTDKKVSIAGTWKAFKWVYEIKQDGNIFSWAIINDQAYGEKADGEFLEGLTIKATWKNKNGEDSGEGTVIVEKGRAVRIEWKNGATFTRVE